MMRQPPNLHEKKYEKNRVIEGILVEHTCNNAIILENHRWFELLIKHLKNKNVERIKYWCLDHDLLLVNDTLISVAQGASIVASLAERFRVSGAKKIIRIATTGALQENINIGSIIVPSSCIRDEGTSYHYIPENVPCIADINFLNTICNYLKNRNFKYTSGLTWTTDGRWKETSEKINLYKSLNCLSIDMETSGLYSFGMSRNLPVVSLNIVTDKPHEDNSEYKGVVQKDLWDKKITPLFLELITKILYGLKNEEI
jgi:purine-nucleoside phosphorylase